MHRAFDDGMMTALRSERNLKFNIAENGTTLQQIVATSSNSITESADSDNNIYPDVMMFRQCRIAHGIIMPAASCVTVIQPLAKGR
eukprot:scaffold27746_cov37-Prasinocladus_malaysianus.AAC.2